MCRYCHATFKISEFGWLIMILIPFLMMFCIACLFYFFEPKNLISIPIVFIFGMLGGGLIGLIVYYFVPIVRVR